MAPQAFHRVFLLALAPAESVALGRSLRPGALLLAPQRMLRPPERPQAFHPALALALAPAESVALGRSLRPQALLPAPQRILGPPHRPQPFHPPQALAGYSPAKPQPSVRQLNRVRSTTPH